jgi:hypothetical protein
MTTSAVLDGAEVENAMEDADLIGSAISSSVVGSNTFVFFAGFDGTDNGVDPFTDGSGDLQTTAVSSLVTQVGTSANVKANYYPGPGTPDAVVGSAAFGPAVTLQAEITAQLAYINFASEATTWLAAGNTGPITSMITSFSRGGEMARENWTGG